MWDPTEPRPYREKGKDVPWLARDGGMIAQADITVKLIRLLNQLFLPFLFPGATVFPSCPLREHSVRWLMILRPGPDPTKVCKVDTPYMQARASPQGPRTMVRCSGMVSNKEDNGLRYGDPVTLAIKASAPLRSRGIAKSTAKLT
ncbi:hypothetical protein BHM03_00021458 [Ensete ventricosum]|nr:hypothetical protein BHM03_00021458 [Ensete ventricosum]